MITSHRCKHCNRTLVDADSVAIGYGPVCYRKIYGKPIKTEKSTERHIRRSKRSITEIPTDLYNLDEVFKDV